MRFAVYTTVGMESFYFNVNVFRDKVKRVLFTGGGGLIWMSITHISAQTLMTYVFITSTFEVFNFLYSRYSSSDSQVSLFVVVFWLHER